MESLDHHNLVAALRDAAHTMTGKRNMRDLDTMLAALVTAAVDTVPLAVGGGITRAEGGRLFSSHATSAEIAELDWAQSELGEGPCITAATDLLDTAIVVAADLAGDDDRLRWPNFAPIAVGTGYRSMISVPLSLNITNRFALNFYAIDARTLDTSAQLTAALFGLQATVLLHGVDHATQLNRALETRDIIGQAKGILIERFVVDGDEAFHMLVRSSQDTNMKLIDVARWLTGDAEQRRERNRRDALPPVGDDPSTG